MNDGEGRGSWYLLTGILLGIVLGVVYSHYFQPVEYIDTAPAVLRADFKDHYRSLIAAAYLANGDLVRARARLELLEDKDIFRALTEQAQRTLAVDGASADAQALGLLAIALGQAPPGPALAITPAQQVPTGTAALSTPADLTAPSPESLEGSIETPLPGELASVQSQATDSLPNSPAATANLEGPFTLLSQEQVCEPKLPAPLIQILVQDQSGQPLASVLVIAAWDGGEERFYTGLKPEKGAGYADFSLTPGLLYSLRIGESGEPVSDLAAVECQTPAGERYWGAWSLTFIQP
jgi:hypothetical protein